MNLPAHQGRKIAFFGGSFDPPHRGHLAVARAAQLALSLDSVLFAPVAVQPLKPQGSTAGFTDRLAMTELAIQGEPSFAVSLADAPTKNRAHNYTIDTLRRLRDELPLGTALYCLMGADSFLNLRSWHRGAEVPFVAPLIVAARPGQQLEDLAAALPPGLSLDRKSSDSCESHGVPMQSFAIHGEAGASTPFFLLPELHIDISASEIRRQVQDADGRQCKRNDLLPESVCDYIALHGLYR